MSEGNRHGQDLIETRISLSLPCRFDTGPLMGRFLRGLREKKILATRCGKCGRTMLPPRQVCALCNEEASRWVELGHEGYIASFDVIMVPFIDPLTGKMKKVPFTVGRVVLDGGDAVLWHYVDETDPEKLGHGRRCRIVWNDDRRGRITDILHFQVLDELQPGL